MKQRTYNIASKEQEIIVHFKGKKYSFINKNSMLDWLVAHHSKNLSGLWVGRLVVFDKATDTCNEPIDLYDIYRKAFYLVKAKKQASTKRPVEVREKNYFFALKLKLVIDSEEPKARPKSCSRMSPSRYDDPYFRKPIKSWKNYRQYQWGK